MFEWKKPSGKVELLIISAFPQPCHRSAHRGSTWFLLSRCKDTNLFRYFQVFSRFFLGIESGPAPRGVKQALECVIGPHRGVPVILKKKEPDRAPVIVFSRLVGEAGADICRLRGQADNRSNRYISRYQNSSCPFWTTFWWLNYQKLSKLTHFFCKFLWFVNKM